MHSLNACCIVEWIEVQNISIYLLLFLLHAISGLLEARDDRLYYTITLASPTSFEQDLDVISALFFYVLEFLVFSKPSSTVFATSWG
jgi:hypothetical protein